LTILPLYRAKLNEKMDNFFFKLLKDEA